MEAFNLSDRLINEAVNTFINVSKREYSITDEDIAIQVKNMLDSGYLPYDIDSFKILAKYLAIRSKNEDTKAICLTGETGRGKTCWMKHFAACKIYTATKLAEDYIKRGKCYLDMLICPPYYDIVPDGYYDIVIDDLGAEPTANIFGIKQELLSEIINTRYMFSESKKPLKLKTYITTNLNKQQLMERYSERTFSRINALCSIIKVNGSDKRLQ